MALNAPSVAAILPELAAMSDAEFLENCGAPPDTDDVAPPPCAIREALTTLVTSCEEALDGRWDRTDDGFKAMIEIAERALAALDEVRS